jgi:hypothetical protein
MKTCRAKGSPGAAAPGDSPGPAGPHRGAAAAAAPSGSRSPGRRYGRGSLPIRLRPPTSATQPAAAKEQGPRLSGRGLCCPGLGGRRGEAP